MSKKKEATKDKNDKSVTSVVIGLIIVILITGWGCMATSYEAAQAASLSEAQENGDIPTRAGALFSLMRSLVVFANTAIDQIPNMFGVIGWHLQNRIWLPIATLLIAGGAIFFGFGLKMMEGVAEDPYQKHRAKRAKRSSETGPPAAKSKRAKSGKKRRKRP